MPFCDTEHGAAGNRKKITKSQWAHIFEHWIKKAVESYKPAELDCKRSPAEPGSFIKGIVGDLASADVVVADLTVHDRTFTTLLRNQPGVETWRSFATASSN